MSFKNLYDKQVKIFYKSVYDCMENNSLRQCTIKTINGEIVNATQSQLFIQDDKDKFHIISMPQIVELHELEEKKECQHLHKTRLSYITTLCTDCGNLLD